MTKQCEICGTSYETKGSHTATRACGRICGTKLAWQNRPVLPKPACATCGTEVPRLHMLFCSKSCSGKARRKSCGVEGCGKPSESRQLGMCSTHARRHRAGIDLIRGLRATLPEGERRIDANGYVRMKVNGRAVAEHRHVMEQMLGRSLRPFETPHHRNGIRSDNRPSNLELWTKPQPAGQRPEDLAAWVCENYPELVAAEMEKRRTGQLRLVAS